MPLTTDPRRANFRIEGADFEPTDISWRFASESEKLAYYRRLGELAVEAKRWELRRGIDVTGKRFAPVKPAGRPDGAAGPALSPHQAESRFQRLLRSIPTARSATVFWSHGWARYVKYHAYQMGPRALPVRDAVGLSPGRQRWVREGARLWWSNKHRLMVVTTPPPPPKRPRRTVQAIPVPYGPSRANVRHPEYDREDITAAGGRLFGRPVSLQDLASAVGAPDDATVEISLKHLDINIIVEGPGYEALRTIKRTVISEELVIENEAFIVDDDRQGRGLGAAVFGRQVEQAARLGVARIETHAARGSHYNGYYTWPRFGYDGPLPYAIRGKIDAGLLSPPYPVEVVSDLMRTEEGRAWWEENGQSVDLKFDLAEGSLSRRVWDGYRDEKAATARPARSRSRTSPPGI